MPFYVTNGRVGKIVLKDLQIKTTIGTVDLNLTTTTCATSQCNTTMNITTEKSGTVILSDMNFTWKGTTNLTINATSTGGGDDTSSDIQNLVVYYSSYLKELFYDWVDIIFFLPNSNNEKNVTPYGQTSSRGVVNITGQGQDLGFDLYMKIDNSSDCLNITFSNSSTKIDGFMLNSTYQNICTLAKDGNCENFGWADLYSCNASESRIIRPNITWKSCCEGCICEI